MPRDLPITEFEAEITTYVGSALTKDVSGQDERSKMAMKYTIAANHALAAHGLTELKAICRSLKAYIIYSPTGRIACEIAVDGLYDGNTVRCTRGLLLSRKGYPRQKTMLELMAFTASQGQTKYQRRK